MRQIALIYEAQNSQATNTLHQMLECDDFTHLYFKNVPETTEIFLEPAHFRGSRSNGRTKFDIII